MPSPLGDPVPLPEVPPSDRFAWEAGTGLSEGEISALRVLASRDGPVTGPALAAGMTKAGQRTTAAAAHSAGAALARKGLAVKGQPSGDPGALVRYEITNRGRERAARHEQAELSPDEAERIAVNRHKCPRCGTPKLNRCRGEDGAILEHPHPERTAKVRAAGVAPGRS